MGDVFLLKLSSDEYHWTLINHDDVIKWKYFPRYWSYVRGIHLAPVVPPHKGQWRGALMFSLICAWTNSWANNQNAGDLRHHCTHYDITVMDKSTLIQIIAWCCQATSHYLGQCRPRSTSTYGITRPQWVNPSHLELFWRNINMCHQISNMTLTSNICCTSSIKHTSTLHIRLLTCSQTINQH